jgi:hypothetical protein
MTSGLAQVEESLSAQKKNQIATFISFIWLNKRLFQLKQPPDCSFNTQ